MTDRLFMDAVITPNRSLSDRGRRRLIAIFAGLDLLIALVFLRIGAGGVAVFLALVLAGLVLALTASARRSQGHERIRVSARHVHVSRHASGREETVWMSATAFTRIAVVDEDYGPGALKLQLSDREIHIADQLSRPERQVFAHRLERAMMRAGAACYGDDPARWGR